MTTPVPSAEALAAVGELFPDAIPDKPYFRMQACHAIDRHFCGLRERANPDLTNEQYHALLDRLWAVLPKDSETIYPSVFDAVIAEVRDLQVERMRLRDERDRLREALGNMVERIEWLAGFHNDLDAAPEGAVPAWDLVALAMDKARSALAGGDAGGEVSDGS